LGSALLLRKCEILFRPGDKFVVCDEPVHLHPVEPGNRGELIVFDLQKNLVGRAPGRHMVALGVPLALALQMVTANPARQIGLGSRKGVLAPGADADLVFLDADLKISGVMTRGAGLSFSD